jgi:tetratricopeptide (TPR) repeat protein
MKKVLFLAVALLTFAATTANAQRVNTAAELKKLEKAEADIANPKKNTKAATWVSYANAYTNAFIVPTKELSRGVPEQVLMMNVGQPLDAFYGEFAGQQAVVVCYEYVDVYIVNGMIQGWNQKKAVAENLAITAIEAYEKAYAMDPKQESKIAAGAAPLVNSLMEQGDALNNMGKVKEAAEAFELAYRAQSIVPSLGADANSLFNAGMLYAITASSTTGEEAQAAFKKGEEVISKALSTGYADEAGNIYYYLFHCYYGQKEADREFYLAKAKEALLTGIQLYPKNTTILDGLMQFYTAEEGVGDPAELVEMIENSLKDDPTNYDLWFGRGRVYNALKNYDECVASFMKCAELRPTEYEPNFYTGYFIIEKANAALTTLNSNTDIDYEQYGVENAKINLIFAEAIPWLEKAYEANPTDFAAVEYLNQLCYRVRDLDGMMDKYNKYHELYMQMK